VELQTCKGERELPGRNGLPDSGSV